MTHAGGCIGYLAKMFPRITETFILSEVLALRRAGVPLRLYSLLPPTRDARMHPQAEALLPEVWVVPQPRWSLIGDFLRAFARCVKRRPATALGLLARSLLPPGADSVRRLFRAVVLADRMALDRVAHLHAAWAHTPASVGRIAARLCGAPWSMGAHAKDIHLARPESLRKKLRSARYTLTCTRGNVNFLGEIGRAEDQVHPPAIELFYHGVDTRYFDAVPDARADAHDTPLLVSVGRLVSKKGFDVLLDAASLLKARGRRFQLQIIGESPLRGELEAHIAQAGLGDVVALRGMLVREEVREAYRQADGVVLACRVAADGDRDGIPNTLAEAMACRRPVVAGRRLAWSGRRLAWSGRRLAWSGGCSVWQSQ